MKYVHQTEASWMSCESPAAMNQHLENHTWMTENIKYNTANHLQIGVER